MNETRLPHLVKCPECGRAVRAETAALMGADYWQHLTREHGISRSIAVRHVRDRLSSVWRSVDRWRGHARGRRVSDDGDLGQAVEKHGEPDRQDPDRAGQSVPGGDVR